MENEQGEKNKPTFWRAPSIVKVKSVGILQVIWYVANVIISTIKKRQWAPLSPPQKKKEKDIKKLRNDMPVQVWKCFQRLTYCHSPTQP